MKGAILLGTLLEMKTTSEWVIPIATDTVDKILHEGLVQEFADQQ